MKGHANYREKCIRSGVDDPDYDEKWGRFKPHERLNVDQSPLPFVVHGKKTYEYVPPKEGSTHNTWIAQPGAGLEKRQCTLQVCFRSEGKQPKLSIIFRGKGKRISADEKLAWHPDIDVLWQDNAWLDQYICLKWFEETFEPFVKKEGLKKFVLLLDNLTGQMQDAFKQAVAKSKGLLWYGLPDATDLWQPVDAGYAACLKSLISIKHRNWLDIEDNAERWFGDEKPYSAKERRILITQWAGKAWEKLGGEKYDKIRKSCRTATGCLITADGSNDNLVTPEGLKDYKVPSPSLADANEVVPSSNIDTTPQAQPVEEENEIAIDENMERGITKHIRHWRMDSTLRY